MLLPLTAVMDTGPSLEVGKDQLLGGLKNAHA